VASTMQPSPTTSRPMPSSPPTQVPPSVTPVRTAAVAAAREAAPLVAAGAAPAQAAAREAAPLVAAAAAPAQAVVRAAAAAEAVGSSGSSSGSGTRDAGEGASCSGLAATCGPSGNASCCSSSVVPGGTFSRSNDATYPATVSDFVLDTYEITVGRFRKFVAVYSQSMIAAGGRKEPKQPKRSRVEHRLERDPACRCQWSDRLRCGLPDVDGQRRQQRKTCR